MSLQSQPSEEFVKSIRHRAATIESKQKARSGTGQVIWDLPANYSRDLLDIANMVDYTGRQDLEEQYRRLVTDNSTTQAQLIANRQQLEYLTAEERAFRSRHMTICRAFALDVGRLQAVSRHLRELHDAVVNMLRVEQPT